MNCPLCHSNNTETKFLKNEYPILECLACGHWFTGFVPTLQEVEQIYSDDYFFKGGAGYSDYTLEKNLLIKRGEYYANKVNKIMKPGKMLDIGSAAGFIQKGFENKGWDTTGIEPNKYMAEYGRSQVGVDISAGTLETFNLEKEKFDLAVVIQVIAHVFDLQGSVSKIYDALKPGGYLLIETWNRSSFTAKIFGKNWHEYSPPGTLNYFSGKTLDKLMSQNNFLKVATGTPKKSIHSKHAKSLIKHKLIESKGLKWMAGLTNLIPGNMILPYPAEDLFWTLYKKTE